MDDWEKIAKNMKTHSSLPMLCLIALFLLVISGLAGSSQAEARSFSRILAVTDSWSEPLNGWAQYSSPVLGDLDRDSEQEIVVGTNESQVFAFNPDGTSVPGWPVSVRASIASTPAIGDVDGDGWLEVAVGVGWNYDLTQDGGIYLLRHDGVVMSGWPKDTQDNNEGPSGNGHPDGVFSSPTLADLDLDGDLEIIFASYDHYIYAYHHDGSPVAGWPVHLRDGSWSSPAVGDVDRDGYPDIVIGCYSHYEPAFSTIDGGAVHVFSHDGAEKKGWPKSIDANIDSSPALADLDGDGFLDVIVGTGTFFAGKGRNVYAWRFDGTPLAGWPVSIGDGAFSSPAVGDMDGDGDLEVVIGCKDGKLYAWHHNGIAVTGWPVSLGGDISSSPVLTDIDGDGDIEVVVVQGWNVVAYHHNGSQTSLSLGIGYSTAATPAVGDLDNDNQLEIVIGALNLSRWELDTSSTKLPWPMFRRDAMHNGHVPAAPILSANPTSLRFLHQTGDTTEPSLTLRLTNDGGCALDWTASAPSSLQVTPTSGTISGTVTASTLVNVKVLNPTQYAAGTTHNLGSVTIFGSSACGTVDNSPRSIPVTFYAGDISRTYLPLVARDHVFALYTDDFSDPTSGWPVSEDGNTGSGYFGLEYGVHISKADLNVPRATARGPFSVSGDYAVQVEARGTTMAFARCGIIFNASADMSRYDYFFIDNRYPNDPIQGSKLRRYENGSHTTLQTNKISGTTVELYEPNTLRVEVDGSQIRAYVDDVLVISYTDSDPPGGGYIGLLAAHAYYGSPPESNWALYHKANCHFDDLVVTRP